VAQGSGRAAVSSDSTVVKKLRASTPSQSATASGPRPAADENTWLSQKERGSLLLIRLTFRMATLFGRRLMRPVVYVVALWYRLFDRRAVASSSDWLRRHHGRKPGFWAVYRHIRIFAQVTMDRMFLLTGKTNGLVFTRTGDDHMRRQIATGKGALLLGAHLGSYEAMRADGAAEDMPIRPLGLFKNTRRINALLESLNPRLMTKVINIGDDPVGMILELRECVERGELVAIHADRTGLNDRIVPARFVGADADFPAGPFLLASLLRCPVYMVFGLYTEPNRYDIYCEPFAERLDLPRKDRERKLREVVQRYADRLEHYCRLAPDNWFNFFDFWRTG